MSSTVGAEVWPGAPEERSPRERMLAAMATETAERGYVNATVRRVSRRAGVSTKTFYGEFANRLDCFLATVDDVVDHAASVAAAAARGHDPCEAFRRGLDAVLGFLADEPVLARVCLVELLCVPDAGGVRRRRAVELAAGPLERCLETAARPLAAAPPALQAEFAVGGMVEAVRSRVRAGATGSLRLLGDELIAAAVGEDVIPRRAAATPANSTVIPLDAESGHSARDGARSPASGPEQAEPARERAGRGRGGAEDAAGAATGVRGAARAGRARGALAG